MRFASIASGSSGNCIYAGTDRTHILVDAGISNRRIELGLKELGLKAEEVDGICLTHEHSDHIAGLSMYLKKHPVPVYATEGTLNQIRKALSVPYAEEFLIPIEADRPFSVGDMEVTPFAISHDAAEPVAYRISGGESQVAVATDLGTYTPYVVQHLQNLNAILLESNHDIHMLETGPYPYYLKQRILGDQGHLCNENAGRLLSEILNDRMTHVLLGHISKENNYPELAWEAVRLEVNLAPNEYRASDFDIQVASRTEMSEIFYV